MRTAPRRFTEVEDNFIVANYRSMPVRDIASELGRPIAGIRKRAGKLGVAKPLKRWCSEEDEVIRAAWGNRAIKDVANELGRGVSEVSSRSKKLGRKRWRQRSGYHSGRPVRGFKNGSPIYEHRAIVEEELGRPLTSDEIVHHIDFDKHNNALSNLVVFDRSQHRKAHSSFESLVPILVERGIIMFDFDKGVYVVCETNK